MRSLLFGLAQVAGLLAFLVGLYMLAGPAWALLVGGAVMAVLALIAELAAGWRPRPARTTPRLED